MIALKKIVTCLDLTTTDDKIIAYTSFLCDILDIEEVSFLHVNNRYEVPSEIREQYPNLVVNFTDKLQAEAIEKVEKNFSCKKPKVTVSAVDGNAVEEILKKAKEIRTDVILMGRKPSHEASGTVPAEISRLSKCSVMIIPNTCEPGLKNIQLTMDFSKYSIMAMEAALQLAEKTNANIYGQHVYHVPSGYHSIGKTYQEFAEIMLGHAKRDFLRFEKHMNIEDRKIEMIYSLDDDLQPTDKIIEAANERRPDLLVIGSRGRTKAAAVLLGSVAKKLIQKLVDTPLLIVKDRKEGLSFLEALRQL